MLPNGDGAADSNCRQWGRDVESRGKQKTRVGRMITWAQGKGKWFEGGNTGNKRREEVEVQSEEKRYKESWLSLLLVVGSNSPSAKGTAQSTGRTITRPSLCLSVHPSVHPSIHPPHSSNCPSFIRACTPPSVHPPIHYYADIFNYLTSAWL